MKTIGKLFLRIIDSSNDYRPFIPRLVVGLSNPPVIHPTAHHYGNGNRNDQDPHPFA